MYTPILLLLNRNIAGRHPETGSTGKTRDTADARQHKCLAILHTARQQIIPCVLTTTLKRPAVCFATLAKRVELSHRILTDYN
jgi:hypothetical protein